MLVFLLPIVFLGTAGLSSAYVAMENHLERQRAEIALDNMAIVLGQLLRGALRGLERDLASAYLSSRMPSGLHTHDICCHGACHGRLSGRAAGRQQLTQKLGLLLRSNHAQVPRQKPVGLIDEKDKPLLSQDR